MTFTNEQIYTTTLAYNQAFENMESYIPAKVNFYMQSNIKKLAATAKEIDAARMEIVKHYGEETEGGYVIPQEKLETAEKELTELFAIEQEIEIKKFNIDDLGDKVELTMPQMQAMMFMIEG